VTAKFPQEESEGSRISFQSNMDNMDCLPIREYLWRLRRQFGCSDVCYILALMYMDRAARLHPTSMTIDATNCHCIFLTSLVIATKFHDDVLFRNSHYARIGGVEVQKLCEMEAQLLALLGWRVRVELRSFRRCRARLYEAAGATGSSDDEDDCPWNAAGDW